MHKSLLRTLTLVVIVLVIITVVVNYSKGKLFTLTATHSTKMQNTILAFYLNKNNPHHKNPNVIDSDTVFLLLKAQQEKLYFLHSLSQLKSLAKHQRNNNTINAQDEIFNHLYLGYYNKKRNAIFYTPFTKKTVLNITFEGNEASDGFITLLANARTQNKYAIEGWTYKEKLLKSLNLKAKPIK